MITFDNNMRCIEEYRSGLYEKLLKGISDQSFNTLKNITSYNTKEEVKAIQVELKDDRKYRLTSFYYPTLAAEQWVEQCDLTSINKVIAVFGLGNGTYIRELIKNIESQEWILIYEPSIEIFKHVLENYDITDIISSPKISLTIENINDNEIRAMLQSTVHWANLYSQRRYCHPQYDKIFEESYLKFLKEIKDNNDKCIILRNTESLFGRVNIKNTFKNMKYLKECNVISEFIDVFPDDVPAIIVSAGPSLDKNIEELKRVNKRAIIFAVDRSLSFLQKHDIEPDYIVTVDPLKPLEYFGDGRVIRTPLFTEVYSNKEILDVHQGRKIFYNALSYVNTILEKIGKPIMNLSIGTSVATATFSICLKLGFKKIILVGQDLAYSDDGISHAGSLDEIEITKEDIWVEGIHGNKVRTRYDWYDFLRWFGDSIIANKDIEVIDATEGGAKIKGTKIMSLRDAIDGYCKAEVDCNSINDSIKPTYNTNDLAVIRKYILESKNDLVIFKRVTKEAIRACDKMIINSKKNIDSCKSSQNLIKKLTKANKLISGNSLYSLIDSYITDSTVDSMRDIYQLSNDDQKNKILTYIRSKEVYEQILVAIDDIQQFIDNEADNLI